MYSLGSNKENCDLVGNNPVTAYDRVLSKYGIDKQDIINIWLLDAITLNTDRHYNNISLLINGDNIRVAPVFDNGRDLAAKYDDYILCDTFEEIKDRSRPFIYDFGNHDYFMHEINYVKLKIDIMNVYRLSKEPIEYYPTEEIKKRWELLLWNLERTEGLYWDEIS